MKTQTAVGSQTHHSNLSVGVGSHCEAGILAARKLASGVGFHSGTAEVERASEPAATCMSFPILISSFPAKSRRALTAPTGSFDQQRPLLVNELQTHRVLGPVRTLSRKLVTEFLSVELQTGRTADLRIPAQRSWQQLRLMDLSGVRFLLWRPVLRGAASPGRAITTDTL